MTLPNFLIIGAARAGTTSLHHYLGQHPEVFTVQRKETNFFAQESATCFLDDAVDGLQEYADQFSGVKDETAIGESSPAYLAVPDAPRRIAAVLPEVRLIAILRNPVDRAYSHYLLRRRQNREEREPFENVLEGPDLDPERSYTERGFYGRFVERYFKFFDREQLSIFLYEDLERDLARVVSECFAFLRVNAFFQPNLSRRYNVNPSAPPLAPETRARLIGLYKYDIRKLETIIRRDLSGWLRV